MLNHIVLMGRLTRDPELRRTGSGVAVASFSLAVDRDFAAQGAEKETDFIDIVAWRNTAEFVSKYFTKGRMLLLSILTRVSKSLIIRFRRLISRLISLRKSVRTSTSISGW